MDADSVSHMMHCKHLITDDDYEAITAAPNDNKMNTLLLQYVRSMNVKQLTKFCDILKSIETTHEFIRNCLSTCKCMRATTKLLLLYDNIDITLYVHRYPVVQNFVGGNIDKFDRFLENQDNNLIVTGILFLKVLFQRQEQNFQ